MGLKEELVSMLERQRLVQYSVVLFVFFYQNFSEKRCTPRLKICERIQYKYKKTEIVELRQQNSGPLKVVMDSFTEQYLKLCGPESGASVPIVLMCDAVRMRVGHVEVNNEAQQAKLTGRLALSVFLAIRDKQMRRICDRDDPGCNGMCAHSQSADIPLQWPLRGLGNPDYKPPHLNSRRSCVVVWEM